MKTSKLSKHITCLAITLLCLALVSVGVLLSLRYSDFLPFLVLSIGGVILYVAIHALAFQLLYTEDTGNSRYDHITKVLTNKEDEDNE